MRVIGANNYKYVRNVTLIQSFDALPRNALLGGQQIRSISLRMG